MCVCWQKCSTLPHHTLLWFMHVGGVNEGRAFPAQYWSCPKVISSGRRVKEEEWDGWGKLGCILGELIALPKGAVRQVRFTFLQTKHAHEHFEFIYLYNTVSRTTSKKLDITGQTFLYCKSQCSIGILQPYSSFIVTKTKMQHVAYCCSMCFHLSVSPTIMKHRPVTKNGKSEALQ